MQGQLGNKICVSWGTEPTLLLSPPWEWHSSGTACWGEAPMHTSPRAAVNSLETRNTAAVAAALHHLCFLNLTSSFLPAKCCYLVILTENYFLLCSLFYLCSEVQL